MVFKSSYATQEDIPASEDALADMYIERDGKWELNVEGLKTDADLARVQTSLSGERDAHKKTKASLAAWGDLKHDEVVTSLDRIPELEAAAGGTLDEAAIEDIVSKRVDTRIRKTMAPLERDLLKVTGERDTLAGDNKVLSAGALTRAREDVLRPLMTAAKIVPEHQEDVLMYAERHLERDDETNTFFAKKDINGVTSGSTPKDWLEELCLRRPGWLGESVGGGARGSGGGGGFSGANPWTRDNWNMTEQGRVQTTKGLEVAQKMAKAAGTVLGGLKPLKKT